MSKTRYLLIFLGIIPSLFLILLIIELGLSPIRTLNRMEQINTATTADSLYFASSYDSLVHIYSYKLALLELASGDSIQLILNLRDSTAILSIHGVPIFTSKLESIHVDPILRKLPNRVYAENFQHPITITVMKSSIVKEPIVERQAPKDTIEAALNAYMPDTLIQNPAFVRLSLANGINVFMEQSKNGNVNAKWIRWKLRFNHRLSRVSDLIRSIFEWKPFEYQPMIVVKLPVNDLRAIYRALPNHTTYIVIYY